MLNWLISKRKVTPLAKDIYPARILDKRTGGFYPALTSCRQLIWMIITIYAIFSLLAAKAVEVVIDQPVCDARAMMGMATLEAKGRGVKPEDWKKQLEGLEATADPKSSFYHGLKFGESDYREVYAYGRTQYREVTYVDLFSSCMAMVGQKVNLPLQ